MDLNKTGLFEAIKEVIIRAQQNVFRQANSALLESYWHIGRLIVEEEQSGKIRATYGEETLKKNWQSSSTTNLAKGSIIPILQICAGSTWRFQNLTQCVKN